jgi:hypothetical protein
METEYTTSTGYKFFYGAVGLAAIGFGVVIINTPGPSANRLILILPLIILAGGLLILINQFKRKVVITDSGIKYTWLFKTAEIAFDDIKGYRMDDKVIYIEPKQAGGNKLRIGDYTTLSDSDGFVAWLATNFKDVNQEDFEEEKQEILHDSTLGATEAERESRMTNAKRYNGIYLVGGTILFFVVTFLHQSNYYLSYALLLYPLAGVALMGLSRGLIILIAKKSSAYSSIGVGLMLPAFALIAQSAVDFSVLSYDNVWVPGIVIAALMFAALYFFGLKRSHPAIGSQLIFAIIIAAAYGFGSTMQINCVFDDSKPQISKTMVVDHHITHGKSTTYHLILGGWPQHPGTDNISVSRSFYEQVRVGDSLNVYQKKGTFNIPWYHVAQ